MVMCEFPSMLETPFIPLGISLQDGLSILKQWGYDVLETSEKEVCFMVKTSTVGTAIYPKNDNVGSVWYDDPLGRETEEGKQKKVRLYLARYGVLKNWELRMDNGWMHYWFNPKDKVAMVYGIHKDVIRFNQYEEKNA